MAKASVTETRRVRYEEDLYAWSQEQASLLRARQPDGLDWDHLAEEIEPWVGAIAASSKAASASSCCIC